MFVNGTGVAADLGSGLAEEERESHPPQTRQAAVSNPDQMDANLLGFSMFIGHIQSPLSFL